MADMKMNTRMNEIIRGNDNWSKIGKRKLQVYNNSIQNKRIVLFFSDLNIGSNGILNNFLKNLFRKD